MGGHAGLFSILPTSPFPHFCGQPVGYILMSSLPMALGHAYYSRNLPIAPFPWSACRVHLMSSLPLALGHARTILTTSTFPHFCGQPVFSNVVFDQARPTLYNNLNVIQLYTCYPFFRRACL